MGWSRPKHSDNPSLAQQATDYNLRIIQGIVEIGANISIRTPAKSIIGRIAIE